MKKLEDVLPSARRSPSPKKKEEPEAPYRWVALVIFLLCLFVAYAFWVQG